MRPTRPTDNKDDEDDEENNDDDPAYRRLLPKSTMTQLARGCRQCSSGAHHRSHLPLLDDRLPTTICLYSTITRMAYDNNTISSYGTHWAS